MLLRALVYTYVAVPEFSRMQHRDDVTGVQWDLGMQLTEREIRYGYGYGYGWVWVRVWMGMGMDGYGYGWVWVWDG